MDWEGGGGVVARRGEEGRGVSGWFCEGVMMDNCNMTISHFLCGGSVWRTQGAGLGVFL